MLQVGLFVREKVSFKPHESQNIHASLVSLSAVLIKAMGKSFKVLRTCRGSLTMATIYVAMFGITVFNIHNVENMCMC